jgi:hypothetical protein
VVCEFEFANALSVSRRLFSLNTDGDNRFDALILSSQRQQLFFNNNGVSQGTLSPTNSIVAGQASKTANVYALNDYAAVLNGGSVVTATSGTMPTVNKISIGSSPVVNWANGHLKSLQFYPRRLTNTQLQRLTE